MSYGGHLASLADDDENLFLGLEVADGNNVWLGGFSRTVDEWAWTDDTDWDYDQWKVSSRVSHQNMFF